MIDRRQVGRTWDPWVTEVEKGQLKLLAKALGETRPIYTDEAAAVAAGYRSVLAPLTFPYCLMADGPGGQQYLRDVGIPTERMLHAEFSLTAIDVICAGDRVRTTRRLADIIVKKGGALEFAVFECEFTNCADERLVARVKSLMAVRTAA